MDKAATLLKGPIFHDDFDSLNPDVWSIAKGGPSVWSVHDSMLKCDLKGDGENWLLTKKPLEGDWLMEVRLQQQPTSAYSGGILFNVQEALRGCYFLKRWGKANETPDARLALYIYSDSESRGAYHFKNPEKEWKKIQEKIYLRDGGWHKIKILKTGGVIATHMDDLLYYTAVWPTFASGNFGFRFYEKGTTYIDWIKVYQVPTMKKHPKNPVLSVGPAGSWEENQVFPGAILEEKGTFYLYYIGKDKSDPKIEAGGVNRIGVATSKNLVDWKKYEKNPILDLGPEGSWDSKMMMCGGIIKHTDGKYYLFYSGFSDWWSGIGVAIGHGPLDPFKKYKGNPIIKPGAPGEFDCQGGFHVFTVFRWKDGKYAMLYPGFNGLYDRGGLATSEDLLHWKSYPRNPVFPGGALGSVDEGHVRPSGVVKVGDTFLMFYEGCHYRVTEGYEEDYTHGGMWYDNDCLAKSKDLLHWERYPFNPILPIGAGEDAPDYIVTEWARPIVVNGKLFVLYALADHYPFSIGLAQIDLSEIEEWLKL